MRRSRPTAEGKKLISQSVPSANPGEADAFRILVLEEFTPLGGVIQLTFFKRRLGQGNTVPVRILMSRAETRDQQFDLRSR